MTTSGSFSPTHEATLNTYGFNADLFKDLQNKLQIGDFDKDRNLIDGPVSLPNLSAFTAWPEENSAREKELFLQGRAAIDAGEVALLILNGGMATRFGGKVKGTVSVLNDLSFLGLRLMAMQHLAPKAPIFILNSFATHDKTLNHLQKNDNFGLTSNNLIHLNQYISIRFRSNGEIFTHNDGSPSFYAPGHGDIFSVLKRSDKFQEFVQQDGRIVMVVNVDNLFADLDPRIIGAHLEHKNEISVEIAPQLPGDRGGAPLLYKNKLQIIEAFRLPHDFIHEQVKFFNTNTLIFDTNVFVTEYPLTWFRVDKSVDNQEVVQFERLMGEITAFKDANFLQVSRSGKNCRFWPIKTPNDLKGMEEAILLRYPWLKLRK